MPDLILVEREPNTKEAKFEDVVKSVEQATVLVPVF